ncbi:MAG: hypothetical protein ACRBFS_19255 [Aureispira sp.]
MKNSYLVQLWKRDKKLAALISVFIIGQLFFSYKQIETLPFFNYGMYARSSPPAATYTHYQLYNAQQKPVLLSNYASATFLAYQLPYYHQLQQQKIINAPLKTTIQQRFATFPVLETYLIEQLTNDTSSLPHAQQWLEKKTAQNKLSLWKENYVWVKNNFVLSTKHLVF